VYVELTERERERERGLFFSADSVLGSFISFSSWFVDTKGPVFNRGELQLATVSF
jgi:hypothetical protein